MLRTTITAAVLGLAAVPTGAFALDSPAPLVLPARLVPAAQEPGEKATEWPEPRDMADLKKSVAKIRAARSDDMESAGRSEIQLEGAAAAPLILRAIAKERKDDALLRLRSALALVTTKEHTRLLAESLDDRSQELRVCVMRRLSSLGDPGLRERVETLYKDIKEKAADPKKAKKLHEDEFDRAAILTMSVGSAEGLDHCLEIAGSKGWPAWRDTMREAAARAKDAGTVVAEGLQSTLAPSATPSINLRVAALRLIAYAGTEAHARSVLPSLDDTANHVKVAAVNALRMMVDGDNPLDKLSTFDAIERATKWKARL